MADANDNSSSNDDQHFPRSELHSHANMVVLSEHAYIFDSTVHKCCDVIPYEPNLEKTSKVPIVDGVVTNDCPYSHITYLLVFRNALHVPSLKHNLLPPFILHEAGLEVNEAAKIHINEPSKTDRAIISKSNDLIIPLQLNGIFSFFRTRKPTINKLSSCDPILFTPDSYEWNPYGSHFASQEESMLDWEGEINVHRKRQRIDIENTSPLKWDIYQDEIDHVRYH